MEPDMWIEFDLKVIHTIAGLSLTAFAGVSEHTRRQYRPQLDYWEWDGATSQLQVTASSYCRIQFRSVDLLNHIPIRPQTILRFMPIVLSRPRSSHILLSHRL